MERIAEVELKSQDIIDLTKSIRLAQNRFCCTGTSRNLSGSLESEDESMYSPSPSRFGRRSMPKPVETHYQL